MAQTPSSLDENYTTDHSCTSSNPSSSTQDYNNEPVIATLPLPHSKSSSIKAELERLSVLAVQSLMRCQFNDPSLQVWSPELKSTYDGVTSKLGRDAMFAIFESAVRENPEQRTEVLDVCTEVDERRGRAKVWLTSVVRGLPGNLCKEGVSLLCWERRKEEWICWRHHGLRGVEGYT